VNVTSKEICVSRALESERMNDEDDKRHHLRLGQLIHHDHRLHHHGAETRIASGNEIEIWNDVEGDSCVHQLDSTDPL